MKKQNLTKQKKKEARGITLIALVITIIVLLILAGVSIATLTGENGILTQAQTSKERTEKAEAKERIELEVQGSHGTDGKINIATLKSNIAKNIPQAIVEGEDYPLTVTLNGYTFTITEKGEVKEFAKKYDIDLISIIVPAPQERVEKIAKDATGYIYLATSLGETDNRADIKGLTAQIRRVTDVPIAIGLGASNHQGVQDALKYADGFIVNATIVKIIGKCGANAHVTIRDFVKNLL